MLETQAIFELYKVQKLLVFSSDGLIEKKKMLVATTSVEVKEYGFTKAVEELCPQGWKDAVGSDWEDKLNLLITHWSPNSYLTKERVIKTEEGSALVQNHIDLLRQGLVLEGGIASPATALRMLGTIDEEERNGITGKY